MIALLGKMLHRSRNLVALLLFGLVIVQSIGLAHAADLMVHPDGAPCRVCDAIGQVATPPAPAEAPTTRFVRAATAVATALPRLDIPPTYSSYAPRAPPTLR